MADINPEKPITSANTPDPYGINAINPESIKYLAFEGGGGKAIAYIGALHVLEALDILPYRISQDEKLKLNGIAGTSGGAINSFLVALGCTADQIRSITSKGEDLDNFYDDPCPGIYRSVIYYKGLNISGFSSDTYFGSKPKFDQIVSDGGKNTTTKSFFSTSLNKSKIHGFKIYQSFKANHKEISLAKKALFKSIQLIYKNETQPLKKLLSGNPENLDMYIHCLFYDRGIFLGANSRQFFRRNLAKYLKENFNHPKDVQTIESENQDLFNNMPIDLFHDIPQIPPNADEINSDKLYDRFPTYYDCLTFAQFYKITKMDIRIICTNATPKKPKMFSLEKTPDFPIADAISMSMSIQGAFKPTFVNAMVDMSKDNEYNRSYNGFYGDGGALNNLPIHAFDDIDDPKVLNRQMFGIRCTDKEDEIFFKDYFRDNLYAKYIELLKEYVTKKESIEKAKVIIKDKIEVAKRILNNNSGESDYQVRNVINNPKPYLGVLFDYLADLYSTITYWTEEGQMRDQDEIDRTIELFTYDVGLFDFDLSKEKHLEYLSNFVQRTAAIKTAYKMGCKKFESYTRLHANYIEIIKAYKKELDIIMVKNHLNKVSDIKLEQLDTIPKEVRIPFILACKIKNKYPNPYGYD
jgi:NTE family protein